MNDTLSKRASSSSPPPGHELDPDKPIGTTEQLRLAIDQGHGGGKVDATDPAAAPRHVRPATPSRLDFRPGESRPLILNSTQEPAQGTVR